MKRLYFLTIILLFSVYANSQTVSYNITIDDPKDIPNTTFYFDPFYVEMYGLNVATLGWGVGGSLQFP